MSGVGGVSLPDLGPVTFGGVGIWTLVVGLIAAYFRMRPLMEKIRSESDSSLRGDLLERITTLEKQQIADRKAHLEQREADRVACLKETEELRSQIREQDRLISGLQRQLIMFQVATGRALPVGANSPEIESMLSILGPLFGAQSEKSGALRAAEDTEHRADDTCHAAKLAVEQIKQDEMPKQGGEK